MKEIGEYLKNRRLELGISLDEAEQYLKIRKKYLIAIEEGNESVLPGKTYFVGYLRNYASYLDVNQEHIDELLEKTEQPSNAVTAEPEPTPKRKKPGRYFSPEKRKPRIKKDKKPINYRPLFIIVIAILILSGIVLIINQFLNKTQQSPVPATPNEENREEVVLEEEKSLEEELIEMAEENNQEEEISEKTSDDFLEPLPEYEPIVITTQEPTWIKVIQNDNTLFESVILSSEEITIKSEGTISLLANETSDISVLYDGQIIEPLPSEDHRLTKYQIVPNNGNN